MKLSKRITENRADRLDEWSMDDLAREAKQLEDAVIALVNGCSNWSMYVSDEDEQNIGSLVAGIHNT
jgi:hypothetical protein